MYYLLKDGRIIDSKSNVNISENQNELRARPNTYLWCVVNGHWDWRPFISLSENLLDLARAGDMLEIWGIMYQLFQDLQGNTTYRDASGNEQLFNFHQPNAQFLWKLSADGKTMTRHEVNK